MSTLGLFSRSIFPQTFSAIFDISWYRLPLLSKNISYVFVTLFSYFKVFQIVRQHQREVHNNVTNIDMRKYRKSISNMLYIVAIFLISYVPLLCCLLMINFLKGKEEKVMSAFTICIIFAFSSTVFNPLFHYWRIKEIRNSVRNIVKWLLHNWNNKNLYSMCSNWFVLYSKFCSCKGGNLPWLLSHNS